MVCAAAAATGGFQTGSMGQKKAPVPEEKSSHSSNPCRFVKVCVWGEGEGGKRRRDKMVALGTVAAAYRGIVVE